MELDVMEDIVYLDEGHIVYKLEIETQEEDPI